MAKKETQSVTLEGDELVIRVRLDAKGTPSKSGKSIVLGSSRGNRPLEELVDGKDLPENVRVGFNIYRQQK